MQVLCLVACDELIDGVQSKLVKRCAHAHWTTNISAQQIIVIQRIIIFLIFQSISNSCPKYLIAQLQKARHACQRDKTCLVLIACQLCKKDYYILRKK